MAFHFRIKSMRFEKSPAWREALSTSKDTSGASSCALVYIDEAGSGGPHNKRRDAFRYIEQAIALNRSLLVAGSRLDVATNVPGEIERYRSAVAADLRPHVFRINASLSLGKAYVSVHTHFRIDLIKQVGMAPTQVQKSACRAWKHLNAPACFLARARR